ncbi:hypothetical protein FOL47_004967 [Perkinsus chesapeaki]|uniref:Uncharacterized protein n=1 Tax=Perkinsus chesapeaki TaxID=330153 RepID=A0A7J6MZA8_PERCH|nr:hypothetical protein FOL47_004967 [Perkinsus chesapeaki]
MRLFAEDFSSILPVFSSISSQVFNLSFDSGKQNPKTATLKTSDSATLMVSMNENVTVYIDIDSQGEFTNATANGQAHIDWPLGINPHLKIGSVRKTVSGVRHAFTEHVSMYFTGRGRSGFVVHEKMFIADEDLGINAEVRFQFALFCWDQGPKKLWQLGSYVVVSANWTEDGMDKTFYDRNGSSGVLLVP